MRLSGLGCFRLLLRKDMPAWQGGGLGFRTLLKVLAGLFQSELSMRRITGFPSPSTMFVASYGLANNLCIPACPLGDQPPSA